MNCLLRHSCELRCSSSGTVGGVWTAGAADSVLLPRGDMGGLVEFGEGGIVSRDSGPSAPPCSFFCDSYDI